MRYRFEHDGQPEARDFDENYAQAGRRTATATTATAREWRTVRISEDARRLTEYRRPRLPLLSLSRLMN